MPALPNVNPTLMDLTKQLDPDGSVATIAEVLNETNEALDEIVWQEGNLTTGHRHTVRTGLPDVTWGRLYRGVQPSRGTNVQVTDNTGWMESLSEVDTRLVKLASDPLKFRYNEDRPHIEAMGQEMVRTMFRGDLSTPEKFLGLDVRFNDPDAANGDNIIDGGSSDGTADKTSIWLVAWSDRSVFGIVPKGSKAGLVQSDEGEDWVTDADGGRYKILRTHFEWYGGIAVPDWRYIVRAPNIRLSELKADAATGPDLPFLLHDMIERLPADAWSGMRVAFYMNRRLPTFIRKQIASQTSSSTLAMAEVGAVGALSPKRKLFFDGIPINRVDQLGFDEPLVSFA